MRRRSSLRRDLVYGFGTGIVAVWCIALFVGGMVLREELDELYDAALARVADHVLAVSHLDGETALGSDLFVELLGPDGTVRFRSAGTDGAVFSMAAGQGFSEAGDMRVLALHSPDGSVLRVADPLKERREAARETLVAMLLPSIILLPLAFLATRIFIRRRLSPIRALSAELEGRSVADLRPLDTRDIPDELQPLRLAVDRLMARLGDAFEAERNFSSNAAHELRTPIAAAYAQTELLLDEAESPGVRQRAETIAQAIQRLSRLSAKLLELARAEAVHDEDPVLQDLALVLRLVARDCSPTNIYDIPAQPVMVRMDMDVFAPLARNLIENAQIHGQPPVRVCLTPSLFQVTNHGAVIDPATLTGLTRRFERGGSRKIGSGLGLAIAETLARNAGARLELLSPIPGGTDGFCARLHFPGAQADPPRPKARV